MSRIKLGEKGFIHAFVNVSFPDLVKLGQTTTHPIERAKQLSAPTATPTPFHCVYYRTVEDCNAAEEALHAAFEDRRVAENREFFRVSLYEATRVMDSLCDDTFSRLEPSTRMAELFATFPDDGSTRELTLDEQRKCRQLEKNLS